MKKNAFITAAAALMILFGCLGMANAEIIPAEGGGWQIGPVSVVLCEELTLREEPHDSAKAIDTLRYGYRPIVIRQENGWAYCALGDSEDATVGWLKADYIVVNPAWYRTEAATPVYAWNDTAACKIALLSRDTILPILKQEGEWLVVSLRGAAGWIHLDAAQ